MGGFLMCALVGCGSSEQTLISLKPMLLLGMVSTIQIRRYAWVVELLLRRKSITIRELNEEWSRSTLVEYPNEKLNRKSWYKCFEDICIIYGIIIEGERKGGLSRWRIINPEFLTDNKVEAWMLASVAHRNMLESCLCMHNRSDIEGFPSENGMLQPIAQAMKENRKLQISYLRYCERIPIEYVVEPYFIKTFNHRFYVLCKSEAGEYVMFSFDRIKSIEILKDRFDFPADIYAEDFFQETLGPTIPADDVKPRYIIIRATGVARFSLLDVPIHKSQSLIFEGYDYTDFSIRIRPTDDFFCSILQHAGQLEIISPNDVRQTIKERLQKALSAYEVG